jgi:hypothetical protein
MPRWHRAFLSSQVWAPVWVWVIFVVMVIIAATVLRVCMIAWGGERIALLATTDGGACPHILATLLAVYTTLFWLPPIGTLTVRYFWSEGGGVWDQGRLHTLHRWCPHLLSR